jgi:glycosyltransferase involved in cell wall biosynthesis
MASLRVLHVIESLRPGGAEVNLASMVARLTPDRFEQHVAWLFSDSQLAERVGAHVAALHPLGLDGRRWLPRAVAGLVRIIRATGAEVVHAQLIRAQVAARIAAAVTRVPIVTTWQNAFYDRAALSDFGDSRLRQESVRLIDLATGLRDRRFIAVSRYVADHLSAALKVPSSRVEVIHNAVDPARHAPVDPTQRSSLRAELGVPAAGKLLLNVGRLVPQKAQRELLVALARLLEGPVRDAYLMIAGGGPLAGELADEASRLGITAHVRLLGARDDLPRLYQSADLFVFPSAYEGLSVALVEAVANGLPVVVSDIPQNIEVVTHSRAARTVPIHQPSKLADAIAEHLVALPSLDEATRDLRADVLARFDAARLAGQLGAVLEAAAA